MESKLSNLTQDLRDNWDMTYSVNMFPPSKELEGENIDLTKNRHILRAKFGSVQRIAEPVQVFEDKYKHLAIRSVWLKDNFAKNEQFLCKMVWCKPMWGKNT